MAKSLSIGTLPDYLGTAEDLGSMFLAIGYDKETNDVEVDSFRITVRDVIQNIASNLPIATYLQNGVVRLANIEESTTEYDPNTGEPITKMELINPENLSDHQVANAKSIIGALSRCLREGGDIDGSKMNILLNELSSLTNIDRYMKEREFSVLVLKDEATGDISGNLIYRLAGDDENGHARYLSFASSQDLNSVTAELDRIRADMNSMQQTLNNKYDKSGGLLSGTITFDVPYVSSQGDRIFKDQDYIAFNSTDTQSSESTSVGTGVQLRRDGQTGMWILSIDGIIVRRSMYVPTLVIDETRSIQGSLVLSPGHGKITDVRTETVGEGANEVEYYRLYFDQEVSYDNEGNKILNNASGTSFDTGDYIRCATYKYGNTLKSYWVPTTSVDQSTGSVLVQKDLFTSSGYPEVGDEVVTFGNRINTARQSLILISAAETNSPLTATYDGINQNTNQCLNDALIEARGNIEGIVTSQGETLHGIGVYIKGNAYITGRLRQISGDGHTVKPVACFKGDFDIEEVYYIGDEFTYAGEYWSFIGDATHDHISGVLPTDPTYGKLFLKIVERGKQGQGAYYVDIMSSNGNAFKNGVINTTLSAVVRCGVDNINHLFDPREIRWERVSDRDSDKISDNEWTYVNLVTREYRHTGFTLPLTSTDVTYKATFNVYAVDDPQVPSDITNFVLRNYALNNGE
jgi:hypothetical protein